MAEQDAGAVLGQGFVAKQPDGGIRGTATYCGFPLVIRLEPDERDGARGYRVMLCAAPAEGADDA